MKTQYQTILILWNKAMNLKDLFYIFSLEITNILTKQKELTFHHTSTFKICSSSFCIKIFITMWHCFIYNICIYIVLYIELVLYIKSHPTAEVQPERDGISPCLHRHMEALISFLSIFVIMRNLSLYLLEAVKKQRKCYALNLILLSTE